MKSKSLLGISIVIVSALSGLTAAAAEEIQQGKLKQNPKYSPVQPTPVGSMATQPQQMGHNPPFAGTLSGDHGQPAKMLPLAGVTQSNGIIRAAWAVELRSDIKKCTDLQGTLSSDGKVCTMPQGAKLPAGVTPFVTK